MTFTTLTDHIYNDIRNEIISGEFKPGERLKELDLAKRFNVSQTPVREALARLSQEELIQIDRYRGATVSVYTAQDFQNLYDIRIFLELPAIRKAAECITDEQLGFVQSLLEQGELALKAGDRSQFEHVDLEFHKVLTECAENPYLSKMTRSNQEKLQTIRKVIAVTQIGPKSQRDHELIVDALVARDSKRAESTLRDHILRTRDEVLDIIASSITQSGQEFLSN
ncbi:GntR family transcriptional regulator [Alicyclobacillus dauci]|uniref:GntR family transcriptional regulator n=1 Tax=Alicyclobacillus dauci TaxID=1475485 RepID=A0ABY6YXQ8_9BACL|nr:GntR family transcriptional regulator [Alicyclobacillus dauci]WAH35182.1 GntR family transcriptional regulator [Alicyclobacillus dauci]